MKLNQGPTFAQLRERVHKQHYREIGNLLARYIARPSAVYGTWLAIRVGLSANQVTGLALFAAVAGSVGIGTGTRTGFLVGTIFLCFSFWLDRVDGQLARWYKTASLNGVYYDYLMHYVANFALGFALGYGLVRRTGDSGWAIAGGMIALGWSALSLHNDCRYKAFFQELKRADGQFLVEAGRGGRPSPAPRWPRRGRGLITWPLYKACEPHVVLIGLIVLSSLSLVSVPLWRFVWLWSVSLMACVAPALALARIARCISKGSVEAEFRLWFQPIEIPAHSEPRPMLSSWSDAPRGVG